MSDHITIRPVDGTYSIRAGGAVIGETKNALELREGGHDPVIYIPREDVEMIFLEKSDTTTTCPHKGEASYYSIIAKSGAIRDAAWSYEDPKDEVSEIKGHLAFTTDRVAVEEV